MKNNNINSVFVILAVVLIVVSLLNFGVIFFKVSEMNKAVTGFATGYVNLTVNTNVGVDINPAWGINWSNGSINSGLSHANLTTSSNASSVSGGNWSTTGVQGILISNTGNTNCSLTINGTKNNTDWFGVGINGPSAYQWNVSNNEANSCSGGGVALASWTSVNHTAIKYCAQMSSLAASNTVWLDVKLQVPSDLSSPNTMLSDTLTITAATAG